MKGTPWTQEQKDEVVRLRNEGKLDKEIGEIVGRTKASVSNMLSKLQLTNAKANRTWTDGEKARLQRLHNQGHADAYIANDLGRSKSSVIGQRHRMGLGEPRYPQIGLVTNSHKYPAKRASPRANKGRKAGGKKDYGAGKWLTQIAKYAKPARLSKSRTCQFIKDEPSADDSCKCGARALSDSAYCEEHHEFTIDREATRKSQQYARRALQREMSGRSRRKGAAGRVGQEEYALGNADDRLERVAGAAPS